MANAPFGVRLLVGAAAMFVEETRKLPQTVLMYPMTLASQAAQFVMRCQQNVAEIVSKGDETLDALFPANDEQPRWATFDEDLEGESPATVPIGAGLDRRTEGRFALYTNSHGAESEATAGWEPAAAETDAPEVAVDLDYATLTLAQLRARLAGLSVAELEALLSYEAATRARAPFQTLLANRITRATAK